MMKHQTLTRSLCLTAAIAAVYAVLTLSLPIFSYGPVQLRLAEALTVLTWFCPEAVVGLTLGCFISNLLGSPYVLDWIFGTLATLLAALWTARMPKRWMAPIPPIVCNMVIVGAEIAWSETGFGAGFLPAWLWNGLTVGVGETIACCVLGTLLLQVLPKVPIFRGFRRV